MANKSKNKGDRLEREVVQQFDFRGITARRTLTSGARHTGEHTYDIDAYPYGIDSAALIGECKNTKNGYKTIYDQLSINDFLVIKANNKGRLYVFPEDVAMRLFEDARRGSIVDIET